MAITCSKRQSGVSLTDVVRSRKVSMPMSVLQSFGKRLSAAGKQFNLIACCFWRCIAITRSANAAGKSSHVTVVHQHQ